MPDPEELSDGYHTMAELYEYRMLYNAAFANELYATWAVDESLNKPIPPVVKSWKHSDGEFCFGGGWFIVTMTLSTGQVSNHYEEKDWGLFRVQAVETAPVWDGHTPAEAAERLRAFCKEF